MACVWSWLCSHPRLLASSRCRANHVGYCTPGAASPISCWYGAPWQLCHHRRSHHQLLARDFSAAARHQLLAHSFLAAAIIAAATCGPCASSEVSRASAGAAAGAVVLRRSFSRPSRSRHIWTHAQQQDGTISGTTQQAALCRRAQSRTGEDHLGLFPRTATDSLGEQQAHLQA